MITERDVVLGIADGRLVSPQVFFGVAFLALRITATGVAWRAAAQEYAIRDRAIWVDDPEMAARWCGAPIVLLHPQGGTLDTASYVNSVIGAVVHAYPRIAGDAPELWCIARLNDLDAAAAIARHGADTSPSVRFSRADAQPITLENGEKWLIERVPQFIDHLAIVPQGVWSKGDAPSGVEIEQGSATA